MGIKRVRGVNYWDDAATDDKKKKKRRRAQEALWHCSLVGDATKQWFSKTKKYIEKKVTINSNLCVIYILVYIYFMKIINEMIEYF